MNVSSQARTRHRQAPVSEVHKWKSLSHRIHFQPIRCVQLYYSRAINHNDRQMYTHTHTHGTQMDVIALKINARPWFRRVFPSGPHVSGPVFSSIGCSLSGSPQIISLHPQHVILPYIHEPSLWSLSLTSFAQYIPPATNYLTLLISIELFLWSTHF